MSEEKSIDDVEHYLGDNFKVIDGALHYRETSDGEWIMRTPEQMTKTIVKMSRLILSYFNSMNSIKESASKTAEDREAGIVAHEDFVNNPHVKELLAWGDKQKEKEAKEKDK